MLPPGVELVLNGDTLDNPHAELPPQDQESLAALLAQCRKREVIWVYGNHDDDYTPAADSGLHVVPHLAIGDETGCPAKGSCQETRKTGRTGSS